MKVFDSSFCAAQPFVPMLPLPSRSRTTSIGLCRQAFVCALPRSCSSALDISVSVPGATATVLGTLRPLLPLTELTVLVASLSITLHFLLGVSTGDTTMLHWCGGSAES